MTIIDELKNQILESYRVVLEYQKNVTFESDARTLARYRNEISDQWKRIAPLLGQYQDVVEGDWDVEIRQIEAICPEKIPSPLPSPTIPEIQHPTVQPVEPPLPKPSKNWFSSLNGTQRTILIVGVFVVCLVLFSFLFVPIIKDWISGPITSNSFYYNVTVQDQNGNPLSGVRVRIMVSELAPLGDLETDDNGFVSISVPDSHVGKLGDLQIDKTGCESKNYYKNLFQDVLPQQIILDCANSN